MAIANRVVEVHAGHVGHHQIGEHDVETTVALEGRERLARSWSGDHVVPVPEQLLDRREERRLVVDDEHPTRGDAGRGALFTALSDFGSMSAGAAGKVTRNVVAPGAESNSIRPPSSVTMRWHIARPTPVPEPTGFVVKNGSKTRPATWRGMPPPVSLTSTTAPPDASRTRRDADPVRRGRPLGDCVGGVGKEVQEHLPQLAARGEHSWRCAVATDDARFRVTARSARASVELEERGEIDRLERFVVHPREDLQVAHDREHAVGPLERAGERVAERRAALDPCRARLPPTAVSRLSRT